MKLKKEIISTPPRLLASQESGYIVSSGRGLALATSTVIQHSITMEERHEPIYVHTIIILQMTTQWLRLGTVPWQTEVLSGGSLIEYQKADRRLNSRVRNTFFIPGFGKRRNEAAIIAQCNFGGEENILGHRPQNTTYTL